MSKIWVTGCAGFLGSHLCDKLLELGHEVGGNDCFLGGEHANIPNGVFFYPINCCDRDDLAFALDGYDYLVHCAAVPHEGLSVFSPHFITTNIIGASVSTYSAAIAAGVKRIVSCSSMARYGAGSPPFREEDRTEPADPYGIGKLASEHFLRNLCATHGTEYVIAVPQNIIGTRQRYDDPYRGVASIFINLALQGRELIIYGDGTQTRRFSPVDGCVDALVEMIFNPNLNGEVINIGPDDNPVTINWLAETIWRLTGHNNEVQKRHIPERPNEVKFAYASVSKARILLGFQSKTSLENCLGQMVEHVRKRGPRPFRYDNLPLEIVNSRTPAAWTERLF